jgi:hypothetical protein
LSLPWLCFTGTYRHHQRWYCVPEISCDPLHLPCFTCELPCYLTDWT